MHFLSNEISVDENITIHTISVFLIVIFKKYIYIKKL